MANVNRAVHIAQCVQGPTRAKAAPTMLLLLLARVRCVVPTANHALLRRNAPCAKVVPMLLMANATSVQTPIAKRARDLATHARVATVALLSSMGHVCRVLFPVVAHALPILVSVRYCSR